MDVYGPKSYWLAKHHVTKCAANEAEPNSGRSWTARLARVVFQWSRGCRVVPMCRDRSAMKSAGVADIPVLKRVNESRKIRKPLMEKRRRARINNCLNELKRMLLDADAELQQLGSRPTKLEKADILELTVRHMQRIQTHSTDPSARFRAGFSECAREVRCELARLELGDEALRERLGAHLDSCLESIGTPHSDEEVSSSSVSPSPPPLTAVVQRASSKAYKLAPTKLPNGDIAFVIPAELRGISSAMVHVASSEKEQPIETVWRPW